MSLWEYGQAVAGYARAHGGEAKPPPPTDARHRELLAKYS